MLEIFAVKLVEKEVFGELKDLLVRKLPLDIAAKYSNYKHSDSLQRSLLGELLMREVLSKKLNSKTNLLRHTAK